MYTKEQQLKKCKDKSIDLMDLSLVVRFDKSELKKRVSFILDKEICQVCEKSYDLDVPHHARYGNAKKDDRYLVNICVSCHRLIHQVGFHKVAKTRTETEDIGWNNHLEYMNDSN